MHWGRSVSGACVSTVWPMPNTWTERPTPASRLIARVLEENDGWNQQAVAHMTGLDANLVSRWLHGKSNPDDRRVVAVARKLGYDPLDFGITDPRALAIVEAEGDRPPAWFVHFREEQQAAWSQINDKLDAILASR